MEINGKRAFLLFLEPKGPSSQTPLIDAVTRKMTAAFRTARQGTSGYGSGEARFDPGGGYRGFHVCKCGTSASCSHDFFIEYSSGEDVSFEPFSEDPQRLLKGYITNSLCIHYVAYHRDEVPQEMIEAIMSFDMVAMPSENELKGKYW